jgi:hypothetical protein
LVALSGHRLTFRHQTLTEFLAAKVVGRLFEDNSDVITSLLADKRWDQTLFLAAGLLQEETARDFVERILAVDIEAAARAAYYIEDGSHAVIQFILDEAIKRVQSNDHVPHLEWAFARLPFSKARHVGSLEILAKTKSSLGGVAAGRLFCMLPQRRKTLIGSGFRHHNDFYYVGAYIRTSDTCWGQKDILYLLKKLSDPHRPWNDALSNYSELVSRISESDLPHVCATFLGTPSPARRIIIEGLTNVDAPFATRILRAAVAEGDRRGMFSLYLHLKYHRRQCDPAELPADANVIGFICDVLKSDSDADASWRAAGLGQQLTAINTEWAEGFRRHASEGGVSERLLIEIIVAHLEQRATPINEALKHLSELKLSEIIVIAHDDFWNAAPPENIIELMETREPWLVAHLPTYLWKPRQEFPILRTYPLDWWLDWIEECHLRLEEKWEWKNAGLVLRHILLEHSKVARRELINRFNSGTPSDFERIGAYVFAYHSFFADHLVGYSSGDGGLAADEVTDETRNLLLTTAQKNQWASYLLGYTATEKFVLSELLPKLTEAPHLSWLRRAVRVAGFQHNRRYDVGI